MRHAFNGKTENPRGDAASSSPAQRISNYTWKLFFPSKSNDPVMLLLLMSELHGRERLSSYRAGSIRQHLSSRLYARFSHTRLFFPPRNISNNIATYEELVRISCNKLARLTFDAIFFYSSADKFS